MRKIDMVITEKVRNKAGKGIESEREKDPAVDSIGGCISSILKVIVLY